MTEPTAPDRTPEPTTGVVDPTSPAEPAIGKPFPRRRFIQVGAGALALGTVAACTPEPPSAPGGPPPTTAPPVTVPPPPPVDYSKRVLVVLEMAGGHDGYSMVVPYRDAAYYRLRPTVSVPASQVIDINGSLGWHPALDKISRRPVAVVEGVGGANPNGSHFEMIRRWWQGDPDGRNPQSTGFFGRICDAVGDPAAPATGVSLGWGGTTPALATRSAVTVAMSPWSDAQFPGPWDANLRATWMAAQRAMGNPDRAEAVTMYNARYGVYNALRFSDAISALPDSTWPYPQTGLGAQLATVVRLIRADIGTRVVFVPMGGPFDSHEGHRGYHDGIMNELDDALDAFLGEVASLGYTDRVLVATFSEFGRRADQNTDGLDHGTTSAMLLAGAVHPGVYGQRPSFTALDRDGNLISPVGMGEYYAVLASFMGVPPGSVLPNNPTAIPGIVTT